MKRIGLMMSIEISGRYAEKMSRIFLKKMGYQIFQADWIAHKDNDNYILVEVKHQEIFEPPPFRGHGLPLWQVKARLKFQKETGVVAILLILDMLTKKWYWQRLDRLESGEYFDTIGLSPRRIYKLNNFEVFPPLDQSVLTGANP